MTPVRRETARVIPVSPYGRALLLRGHDPAAPGFSYWFTIGGQIEPGESARGAAVRELSEETGIVAAEESLIGPIHRGEHWYSFEGVEYHSRSVFFALRMDERAIQPVGLPGEILSEARWWDEHDIRSAPLSNPQIPDVVCRALRAAGATGNTR